MQHVIEVRAGDELLVDVAIDYKQPGWRDAFVKATPDGVHASGILHWQAFANPRK
jgi:hypothetical protein